MYYNKQKYVSDDLVVYDTEHNKKQKHKSDKLNYKCDTYKSNDEYEQDLYNIKEEAVFIPMNPILEHKIEFVSMPHIEYTVYTEEKQETKHYGDIEFYEWLKKQNDPKLALFAELVNAPKLHKSIEEMRYNKQKIETISIQEYKKLKKLGSRSVKLIKELKEKYGIVILKFLYTSIS